MVYVRFFSCVCDTHCLNIFVNGELVAKGLKCGGFSHFHRAKAGVYHIKAASYNAESSFVFEDLIGLLDETTYTLALTGSAMHPVLSVISYSAHQAPAMRLPNVRFASLLPGDVAVRINIDGHFLEESLLSGDASDVCTIAEGRHKFMVCDIGGNIILQTTMDIAPQGNYLGVICVNQAKLYLHLAPNLPVL